MWRKRFGALQPNDVKRLKQLEQDNGRLKRLLAERDLEVDVLKEIAAGKFQAHPIVGRPWSTAWAAACRSDVRAPC